MCKCRGKNVLRKKKGDIFILDSRTLEGQIKNRSFAPEFQLKDKNSHQNPLRCCVTLLRQIVSEISAILIIRSAIFTPLWLMDEIDGYWHFFFSFSQWTFAWKVKKPKITFGEACSKRFYFLRVLRNVCFLNSLTEIKKISLTKIEHFPN